MSPRFSFFPHAQKGHAVTDAHSPKKDIAGIVVAALLAILAAVIARDGMNLSSNNVYGLGPQAMPYVVASELTLLAIGNFVNAMRGDMLARESADWRPVLLILGGLAALIALIALGGGFILAETALFVATSAAFGRRALVTDAIIAFAIATAIYLAFDRLLTLSLPAGPLERLF